MPVTPVNRKRDTYYLHAGKTKTGKSRYWFSTKVDDDLVESMPAGYEVYATLMHRCFCARSCPDSSQTRRLPS